jgi:hypothetical protein
LENEKDIDMPFLMGDVSASVTAIKPAGVIVEEMVEQAVDMLKIGSSFIITGPPSKL